MLIVPVQITNGIVHLTNSLWQSNFVFYVLSEVKLILISKVAPDVLFLRNLK